MKEEAAICKIAKSESKMSVYSQRCAVIGSQFGIWKLTREPDKSDTIPISLYFDEDAPDYPSVELRTEFKGTETWTGRGELRLPDFKQFVIFLQSMMFPTATMPTHTED